MREELTTKVHVGEKLQWIPFIEHRKVFYQEIASKDDADGLGVKVSSLLRERIEIGGAVLSHYHDVAEIIHIIVGKVRLLFNGEWKSFKAGDTFLIPAGVVHSVVNDDTSATEQISLFLPVSDEFPQNKNFKSYMVNCSQ